MLALGSRPKKIFAALLSLALFLAMVAFILWHRPSSGADFPYSQSSAEIQIQPKPRDFAIGNRQVYLIHAGEIDGEASLTPVSSAAEGETAVDAQAFGVLSAFQERPAPYGGQITSTVACDAQKFVSERSIPFAGKTSRLILAVASGRRIFGSCSAEEIKFASAFWVALDEPRKLVVVVKLFEPVAGLNAVAKSQQDLLGVLRRVAARPESKNPPFLSLFR